MKRAFAFGIATNQRGSIILPSSIATVWNIREDRVTMHTPASIIELSHTKLTARDCIRSQADLIRFEQMGGQF